MSILLLLLGLALLIGVAIDIFTTIIHMEGGGIISKFLSSSIWKLLYRLAGGNPRSAFLNYAGSLILTYLVVSWILIIWIGYSLVYIWDVDSVVNSTTQIPADVFEKIYYVGYTLTSLGNGDFMPSTDYWRITSNIMGITSLFFVTLGITYLIPVLQAAIDKRTLAIYINKLGKSPQQIISNGWNGEDFSCLYDRFTTLEKMILEHGERHLAYPILHYFHSKQPEYSAPLNLAALDEAITIQEVYRIDQSPKAYNWMIMRRALDNYLNKLSGNFIEAAEEPPPFRYDDLLPESLPTDPLSDKEKEARLQQLSDRRATLRGLIEKDGWQWEDLLRNEESEDPA